MKEDVFMVLGRPPQVDLEPARYNFFANVPVKMCENSDIRKKHFSGLVSFSHTEMCACWTYLLLRESFLTHTP